MENTSDNKEVISELNTIIENFDKKESLEYYLNTCDILNEYYSKKEGTKENTEITQLKPSTIATSEDSNLI